MFAVVADALSPIPILWQDEHLLVVDKPAGLLVVGAEGRHGPTLIDRLTRQLGQRVFPVHRLDEDTTGVIVVARTATAREKLEVVFRTHEATRVYLALACRMPSPPAGRIESNLAVDADGIVRSVSQGGERAITIYRAVERRASGVLLECRLETGRRNQIRAHLAGIGAAIVEDRKYGWRARPYEAKPKRPLLHAWRIELTHPLTGQRLEISADPAEPELAPRRD